MRNEFLQGLLDSIRGKNVKRLNELSKTLDSLMWHGGEYAFPPAYKRLTIKEYAEEYGCKTFVETGTAEGHTTYSCLETFDVLHTVELYRPFYEKAVKRFEGIEKVKCYFGNSKDVLPEILSQIKSKPLFWLDAHYSGKGTAQAEDKDTPILEELELILNSVKDCVILIDDAREFGTEKDYPTIFKLKKFISKKVPTAEIEVYQDIIRVVIP